MRRSVGAHYGRSPFAKAGMGISLGEAVQQECSAPSFAVPRLMEMM